MAGDTELAVVKKHEECPLCGSTTGEHDPRGLCYAKQLAEATRREQRAMRPDDQTLWNPDEVPAPTGSTALSVPTRAFDRDAGPEELLSLRGDEELPPRQIGLVQAVVSTTALTAPFRVDGSLHKGTERWANTPVFERLWRETAAARLDLLLKPDVLDEVGRADPAIRFRYLHASHLKAPWTPSLVMNLWWMHAMVGNYRRYNEEGNFTPWWEGPDPSDKNASMGERVFQIAIHTFRHAGLEEQAFLAEQGLQIFKKRTLWAARAPEWKWRKFNVELDIIRRGPMEINRAEDWQMFVMTIRVTYPDNWTAIAKRMRQAELRKPSPPLEDPWSNDPYGVFNTRKAKEPAPYFGDMPHHRMNMTFGEWAVEAMPTIDLYDPELW